MDQQSKKGSCPHYKRHCELECPTCFEFFPCRFCHNDKHYLNNPDPQKIHEMDRFQVKTVRCLRCSMIQPISKACAGCGGSFGAYACLLCRLFDNDGEAKGNFHCEGCGICRVGGRQNFQHCVACGICMPVGGHKCKGLSMVGNCPVCQQDLFHSTNSAFFLPCGHPIHAKCSTKLYICPYCSKLTLPEKIFNKYMKMDIDAFPMPPEYKNWRMEILCNECLAKNFVKFHLVGARCPSCKSYNTKRLREMEKLSAQEEAKYAQNEEEQSHQEQEENEEWEDNDSEEEEQQPQNSEHNE